MLSIDCYCCRARLAKLRAVGDPIDFRRAEVGRRAAIAAKVAKFVTMAEGALESWPKTKPWLNATDLSAFAKEVPLWSNCMVSVFDTLAWTNRFAATAKRAGASKLRLSDGFSSKLLFQ